MSYLPSKSSLYQNLTARIGNPAVGLGTLTILHQQIKLELRVEENQIFQVNMDFFQQTTTFLRNLDDVWVLLRLTFLSHQVSVILLTFSFLINHSFLRCMSRTKIKLDYTFFILLPYAQIVATDLNVIESMGKNFYFPRVQKSEVLLFYSYRT